MAPTLSQPAPQPQPARAQPPAPAVLAARSAALAERFAQIARTQMAGLPLLHPGLRVEALGFEPLDMDTDSGLDTEAAGTAHDTAPDRPGPVPAACGILLTPWFMNLVWLPLAHLDGPRQAGLRRERRLGGQGFEFLTAWDPVLGAYEACSLFSPMQDFVDHAAARATAHEVLRLLRDLPVAAEPPATQRAAAASPAAAAAATALPTPTRSAPERPARRAFLTGRGARA